jgi:hypothetical protein
MLSRAITAFQRRMCTRWHRCWADAAIAPRPSQGTPPVFSRTGGRLGSAAAVPLALSRHGRQACAAPHGAGRHPLDCASWGDRRPVMAAKVTAASSSVAEPSSRSAAAISANYEVASTRQSVSKHLAIQEAANLVTSVWRGREKLHYLNAAPISDIVGRWIDRDDPAGVRALPDLKLAWTVRCAGAKDERVRARTAAFTAPTPHLLRMRTRARHPVGRVRPGAHYRPDARGCGLASSPSRLLRIAGPAGPWEWHPASSVPA